MKTKDGMLFGRFKRTAGGHGGIRRITQIDNALSGQYNYSMTTSQDKTALSYLNTRWGKLVYKWLKYKYNILEAWKDSGENHFRYSIEWTERYKKSFDSFQYVFIEDPVFFAPMIDAIYNKQNLPMVVFIQNIESLATENIEADKRLDFFRFEIELLKKTNLCVTISREETFLLKNLGINVHYFPYYPSIEVEKRMLDIREKRKTKEKKNILFIGTVGNPPTRAGLRSLIDAWGKYKLHQTGQTLIIAGYGTQSCTSYAKDISGINFLGAIEDEMLDELLTEAVCTLVYQPVGSGALTKITEMLIANVPIVANSHALRSYYNLSGVYEFVTFAQMAQVILDDHFGQKDADIPDKPDISKLREAIANSINVT